MSDSAESVIRGTFFIPWMSDSGETDNCGAVLPVWLSVSGESDNQGAKGRRNRVGQRTRKTMMMIMAKPVRSVKVNVSPAHATAVMVAMTGSLVPSMVARTAPTRITPAM